MLALKVAATLVKLAIPPPIIRTFPGGGKSVHLQTTGWPTTQTWPASSLIGRRELGSYTNIHTQCVPKLNFNILFTKHM